jgi:hypothetical protein
VSTGGIAGPREPLDGARGAEMLRHVEAMLSNSRETTA